MRRGTRGENSLEKKKKKILKEATSHQMPRKKRSCRALLIGWTGEKKKNKAKRRRKLAPSGNA